MRTAIPNPVMSIRVVLNSVKQKTIRFWDALPIPVKKSIMLLTLPLMFGYYAIKEAELRDNHVT